MRRGRKGRTGDTEMTAVTEDIEASEDGIVMRATTIVATGCDTETTAMCVGVTELTVVSGRVTEIAVKMMTEARDATTTIEVMRDGIGSDMTMKTTGEEADITDQTQKTATKGGVRATTALMIINTTIYTKTIGNGHARGLDHLIVRD
jgi:hypothetical protein